MIKSKSEIRLPSTKRATSRNSNISRISTVQNLAVTKKKIETDSFSQNPLSLIKDLKFPSLKPSIELSSRVLPRRPPTHLRMISANRLNA